MEHERLTEELLHELLDAPTVDSFLGSHELPDISLSDYLQQLLEEKHLERVRVVRMADLNETFGYQIFTGHKVLQITFAMALSVRETNRALTAAGVARLDPKCRRDAIILFCIDRARSLQKVNEELYRLGEDTIC